MDRFTTAADVAAQDEAALADLRFDQIMALDRRAHAKQMTHFKGGDVSFQLGKLHEDEAKARNRTLSEEETVALDLYRIDMAGSPRMGSYWHDLSVPLQDAYRLRAREWMAKHLQAAA